MREQIIPFNQMIGPHRVEYRVAGGEIVLGPIHNSILMITFSAGTIVGELTTMDSDGSDVEMWMAPVEHTCTFDDHGTDSDCDVCRWLP